MNLTYKLGKLFRVDSLHSAYEHTRRILHPVDLKPMLRGINPVQLALLRERYLEHESDCDVGNSAKFADAEYWLRVNVERAQFLRLNDGGPLRILDLGCGAGYFLYVCKMLGHEAVGMDIDENPLFRETTALLGVERIIHRIEAFAPLPVAGGNFDLVTAHCICFQKLPPSANGKRREWDVEAWRFFLQDVRASLLTPKGRLLLDFNPRGGGVYYPPEVSKLFEEEGARFFRSKVLL